MLYFSIFFFLWVRYFFLNFHVEIFFLEMYRYKKSAGLYHGFFIFFLCLFCISEVFVTPFSFLPASFIRVCIYYSFLVSVLCSGFSSILVFFLHVICLYSVLYHFSFDFYLSIQYLLYHLVTIVFSMQNCEFSATCIFTSTEILMLVM